VDVVVTILDRWARFCSKRIARMAHLGPRRHRSLERAPGNYRVRISRAAGPTGRYQIELMERRLPTEVDRSRIEAEQPNSKRTPNPNPVPARGDFVLLSSMSAQGRFGVVWRTPLKRSSVCGVSAKMYTSLSEERKALDYFGQSPSPLPRYRRPSWRSHHSDLHRPVVLPSGREAKSLGLLGQAYHLTARWAIGLARLRL